MKKREFEDEGEGKREMRKKIKEGRRRRMKKGEKVEEGSV